METPLPLPREIDFSEDLEVWRTVVDSAVRWPDVCTPFSLVNKREE